MVFNSADRFMKIFKMSFKLQSGHEFITKIAIFNEQRVITPKEYKPELQCLCSVQRVVSSLSLLYIYGQFNEKNVSNGFS